MNESSEQEYEVLIRCTHNEKKFASRVSHLFINHSRTSAYLLRREVWSRQSSGMIKANISDTPIFPIDIYANLLHPPQSFHGPQYAQKGQEARESES
jgi:hypothetical protein